MAKAGLVVIFLSIALPTVGQELDSIILKTNPTPYISLDSRNTVVQSNAVRFFGVKLGLEWLDQYRGGLGYYTLTSDVEVNTEYDGRDIKGDLSFNYSTLFAEYQFYTSKKWALNVTLHNGFGQSYLVPANRKGGIPGRIEKQFVWLLEPQVRARYKILNWLGLGGAVGLRKTLVPDFLKTNNLNGGTVSINFQVFPIKAFKAVKQSLENSD